MAAGSSRPAPQAARPARREQPGEPAGTPSLASPVTRPGGGLRVTGAPANLPVVDVRRLAREERADFAAFLATLPPQQWQAPTLCTAWRVRDVVAHVISYDDLGGAGSPHARGPGRFHLGRINAAALRRYDTRSPQQLLALLADHPQPRGVVPAALGGRAGLAETLIHHQDIRRGLARPRQVPAERLLPALHTAFIAPDIRGLWRIRGLRLVATDLRFSAGVGPEVRGAAEALLMAMPAGAAWPANCPAPARQSLPAASAADDHFGTTARAHPANLAQTLITDRRHERIVAPCLIA